MSNSPGDFFSFSHYGRGFFSALDIIKKHPEANTVSTKTQKFVKVYVLISLLVLVGVFSSVFIFFPERTLTATASIAAILTLVTIGFLFLPFLILISIIDRDSNFSKVAQQLEYGGKPKNYDSLMINIEKYGLIVSLLIGLFVYFLYSDLGIIRSLGIPTGMYYITDGFLTIIKKRDYTLDHFHGSWAEGRSAVRMGVWYILIGILCLILSILGTPYLEDFFGVEYGRIK